ncbi:uncharacterized protein LOC120706156 [Panicum virgatum]|uniref:Uncharacterized protein n=1 Tax=Panicum virgatum TaxID=38727 RepID=A0A8T0XQ38_PANVG|nr:uncharacterized protein LOC120706156 [Panicum virgatum]KAG2659304.1 hypothetical protein PVAP13_1KG345000 [Panicum virgatum]
MASMMGGDLVEAYVLKNAYTEKLRRMAAAAAEEEEGTAKRRGAGASAGRKKASSSGGGRGGGLFGLVKKKVHPNKAAA